MPRVAGERSASRTSATASTARRTRARCERPSAVLLSSVYCILATFVRPSEHPSRGTVPFFWHSAIFLAQCLKSWHSRPKHRLDPHFRTDWLAGGSFPAVLAGVAALIGWPQWLPHHCRPRAARALPPGIDPIVFCVWLRLAGGLRRLGVSPPDPWPSLAAAAARSAASSRSRNGRIARGGGTACAFALRRSARLRSPCGD